MTKSRLEGSPTERQATTGSAPLDPRIFHITHVDNLASIFEAGRLFCDRERVARKLSSTNIAHVHIKDRRQKRNVPTRGGGTLSDYVPFNFCSRSVMLCAVHQGHQDYLGGQEAIVHLVSSVSAATATGQAWAFTDRHAELGYALFFDSLDDLSEVQWNVMEQKYRSKVKQERQAEFLVRDFFPVSAIQQIVTMTTETANMVAQIRTLPADVRVDIRRKWYY